jgi:hypothetical protein
MRYAAQHLPACHARKQQLQTALDFAPHSNLSHNVIAPHQAYQQAFARI